MTSTPRPLRALSPLLLCLCACGSGTAALVSGSGGGGNAASAISGFRVEDAKVAPARLRFVLTDAEADPARVELFYRLAGAAPRPLAGASGGAAQTLATSADGVEHVLAWDFSLEPDLPDDGAFTAAVEVFALVEGGQQSVVPGANQAELGVGNDLPVVSVAGTPNGALSGVAPIELVVRDSSGDTVSVRAEYDLVGDVPDAGWRLARPAPEDATPDLAIDGVVAEPGGSALAFFWDTLADVGAEELEARLRFTAIDDVGAGPTAESAPLLVDNNREPLLKLDVGGFLSSADAGGGIPIAFELEDPEADEVLVVFQWRPAGAAFLPLPQERSAVEALLADPEQRRALRIAEPFSVPHDGTLTPVGPTTVRVEGTGVPAPGAHTPGFVGAELELLRSPQEWTSLSEDWEQPVDGVVAASPSGTAGELVVLLSTEAAGWRLERVDERSGERIATLATGAGLPDALDRDMVRGLWWVATHDADRWSVHRVEEPAEGGPSDVRTVTPEGQQPPSRPKAVLGVARDVALLTVGDALWRADVSAGASPPTARMLTGLAAPWGLAADPTDPAVVYLAESGADRIVRVDLGAPFVVPVPLGAGAELVKAPRALCSLGREGAFLVVAEDAARAPRLVRVGPGRALHPDCMPAGEPLVAPERLALPSVFARLARDPGGALVAVDPGSGDVQVAGGQEQRVRVAAFDSASGLVELEQAPAPPARPGQRWRLGRGVTRLFPASVEGRDHVFVWDSREVPRGESVVLRGVPYDARRGIEDETAVGKAIRDRFPERAQLLDLPDSRDAFALEQADFDGDGDADLVVAQWVTDRILVYLQREAGRYEPEPLRFGPYEELTFPHAMVVRDIDGDGRTDVVITNQSGPGALLFRQVAPLELAPQPLLLPAENAGWVAVADLEPDGDLDVVLATGDSALSIWRQVAPGRFASRVELAETGGAGAWRVWVADLDGDGRPDIVTRNAGDPEVSFDDTLRVLWQEPGGGFAIDPVGFQVSSCSEAVWPVDFDGDGDLDLVVTDGSFQIPVYGFGCGSAVTRMLRQDAPRAFTLQDLDVHPDSANGTALEVADLDGNGRLDLLFPVDNDASILVRDQAPGGSLGTRHVSTASVSGEFLPRTVRAADLDGDGALDLFGTVVNSPQLYVLRSTGERTSFPRGDVLGVSQGSASLARAPAAGDFDGDGLADIVRPSDYPGSSGGGDARGFLVFGQSTPGVFDPLGVPASGFLRHFDVLAHDLDADGRCDVAALTQNYRLQVWLQAPDGGFLEPNVEVSERMTVHAAAGDVDGDGDLDLVLASDADVQDYRIYLHLQSEPGVWDTAGTALGQAGDLTSPGRLALTDLDRDGDLDVVIPDPFGMGVVTYLQSGGGRFESEASPIRVPGFTESVTRIVPRDVDGDGRTDLVALASQNEAPWVLWQEPDGHFVAGDLTAQCGTGQQSPSDLVAGDVDGDGDVDLVLAVPTSASGYGVFWYEQLAPRRIAPIARLVEGFDEVGPFGLLLADWSGDGTLDLALSGPGDRVYAFVGER